MKWSYKEYQDLLREIAEKLASRDFHSQEYVDILVQEIIKEAAER